MKLRTLLLCGLLATGMTGVAAAHTPADAQASDRAAIAQVVDNYARYMTAGSEQGFESLLLDQDIPFAAVSAHAAIAGSAALKDYASFRKAVFASGDKYRQVFSNVKIDDVGPLAQVSLTFTVERLDGKGKAYTGWKILQLVKSKGAWKIASELYTFDGS
ncbi:nuclear transport factor 2 family protein [Dyella acidiphila]|uniref:SnoaL-like domain-containing protein n=1 Tax=Dyella acidiphila TaxID=2775866 RepID=A0ABR9G9I3_9GAMM|nr:nuclear transport factor 2 family protein [Dyella acidiphila]MBE1160706.1 hypothetical protein [Dyella acidiphila]